MGNKKLKKEEGQVWMEQKAQKHMRGGGSLISYMMKKMVEACDN